jgi:hypothetical protein
MTGHATEHRALPSQLTAHLDSELGLDASDVRLHTDAEAAHRVAGAGAVAGTVDNDVSFAAGAFRPDSRTGRHLIAHELAHVAQQHGGTGGPSMGPAALEAQADRAATAFDRGWPVPALSGAPLGVQHKVAMRDVGRGEQSGFARVGELIDRLNAVSQGLTFSVDADGLLQAEPVEGATLSEFDRQLQTYINDPATIPLRFTNRHGLIRNADTGQFTNRVGIDLYSAVYVDVDDLLASSDVGLQLAMVHFLRERQATRNYARRIGTPGMDPDANAAAQPEFDASHRAGLTAELAVLRDFFGDPSIRVVGDPNDRVYRNDRGDTLRTVVTEGHGAAGAGIDAVSMKVTLHDTHKVISGEEYRELLEEERTKQQIERERLQGATEYREGGRSVPAP